MNTNYIPVSKIYPNASPDNLALLEKMVDAAHAAGNRLFELYLPSARPTDRDDIFAAVKRNEETSLNDLRTALEAARPEAKWVDDNQENTALPPGEYWTVDAVEGNVNHVHGLPEWCVSVTLLADNAPVLTAIYQPIGDLTYTAVRGGGAHLNGQPLKTSLKSDLGVAIVTTGQAEAGQKETYRRIGDSITAMLGRALLVRATVPSTFPLLLVAGGHYDVFWQYEPVLPGVAAGALLITEAGGIVSDTKGHTWRPGSSDFLAAAPHLHTATIEVLSTLT